MIFKELFVGNIAVSHVLHANGFLIALSRSNWLKSVQFGFLFLLFSIWSKCQLNRNKIWRMLSKQKAINEEKKEKKILSKLWNYAMTIYTFYIFKQFIKTLIKYNNLKQKKGISHVIFFLHMSKIPHKKKKERAKKWCKCYLDSCKNVTTVCICIIYLLTIKIQCKTKFLTSFAIWLFSVQHMHHFSINSQGVHTWTSIHGHTVMLTIQLFFFFF